MLSVETKYVLKSSNPIFILRLILSHQKLTPLSFGRFAKCDVVLYTPAISESGLFTLLLRLGGLGGGSRSPTQAMLALFRQPEVQQ